MAINLEMMKQLIAEFTEKETVTREEIAIIQQQIGELEQRILSSNDKLKALGDDREKVNAMMSKYVGGSKPALSPLTSGVSLKAPALSLTENSTTSPFVATQDTPVVNVQNRNDQPAKSVGRGNKDVKKEVLPESDSSPDVPQLAQDAEANVAESEADGDDTVKSINDALRGLFR